MKAGNRDLVGIGLFLFGITQLGLAAWQVLDPGSFFEQVGPFGDRNDHYIGDSAAFVAGPAIGALLAIRRRSWRVPVLVILVAQTGLHALNHLFDIGEADPESIGVVDFVLLLGGTVLLAGLVRYALREEPR